MSYKSLLFCPDENTARAVTQVLTELEFAVGLAGEPFSAVKKLTDERFDALVVDCQNEQDAALLFKTARDSSQNHSSLSVAIVEGQAGVAKAFRIGANLVLTKPINVEQSKGTLRVARGLLRKHEAKPVTAAAPAETAKPFSVPAANLTISQAPVASASVMAKAEAPFSAIEVESDPIPATEAAEAALLESLPDVSGNIARESSAPVPQTLPQPIAAGTSGQGAAVAPALEKIPTLGLNTGSAAPMVTNQPIIPETRFAQLDTPAAVDVPQFASLESSARQSGAGTKVLMYFAILLLGVLTGFFGWRKLQPLQYLHNRAATSSTTTDSSAQQISEAPSQSPASGQSAPEVAPSGSWPASSSSAASPEEISALPASKQNDNIETIQVQELPLSGEPKPAPKTEPLIVKPDSAQNSLAKHLPGAPPSVMVAGNGSESALNVLAPASPTLPTLAPGSMRISQGISQGLLLKKVAPVYPSMALQMHKEGSVEVLATISKQGVVTNVKLLNGDPAFSRAALDAVRQWKYRPYLLNGEPVETQTQITITFKLPK